MSRCQLTAAIELHAVSKSYPTGSGHVVQALASSSLAAERGESVAVVGPSGAGKSTLLAIAGLLLKPDTGTVSIDGRAAPDAEEDRARFRAEKLGFVFQSFNLFDHLTALDNVLSGLRRWPRRGDPDRNAAMEVLSRVGLQARARHMPSELSGGEQQRVAIARALVKRPAALLADEPTGNVDDETSRTICDLLLSVTHDTTLLIVTHDSAVAARCDRAVFLRVDRGHP